MPVWSVNNNTSLLVVFVFLCGSRARCTSCLLLLMMIIIVTLLNRGHVVVVQRCAAQFGWLDLRPLRRQVQFWVSTPNLRVDGLCRHTYRLILLRNILIGSLFTLTFVFFWDASIFDFFKVDISLGVRGKLLPMI
jgi:hypothetical protein